MAIRRATVAQAPRRVTRVRSLAGAATTGSVVSRPDTTAPAIALTLVLVLGSAAVLIALVTAVVEPKAASFGELAFPQRQGAETLLFLTAFGVLLPLGAILGPRVARTVDPGVLPALAGVLAASLAVALLVARLGSAPGHRAWCRSYWSRGPRRRAR